MRVRRGYSLVELLACLAIGSTIFVLASSLQVEALRSITRTGESARSPLQPLTARQIRLDLTCGADAALYDQPLTLVTRVPAAWAKCLVAQRTQKITVAAANGEVRFDARPNAGAITLTPQ